MRDMHQIIQHRLIADAGRAHCPAINTASCPDQNAVAYYHAANMRQLYRAVIGDLKTKTRTSYNCIRLDGYIIAKSAMRQHAVCPYVAVVSDLDTIMDNRASIDPASRANLHRRSTHHPRANHNPFGTILPFEPILILVGRCYHAR